ncbi:MAG: segregation/condensation protein A [Planctomycetota bacterium]|jgi:segregation and condensation protein A
MIAFDVDLPSYHGPLDLLVYLIRREELEIEHISLARVTSQYAEFIDVLSQLDLDNISEFLDIVSQLIEMKAERVLPSLDSDAENPANPSDLQSPHLIERLVQYKRFRDVASVLDEQSRLWQLRYGRLSVDLPKRRIAAEEQPIARIEIWDLVSAFGRILKARQKLPTQEIRYDDTPIHIYMQKIHARVLQQGRVELQEFFEPGMHKSGLVAIFLATLEMTRHHGLLAAQPDADGPLWIEAGPSFPEELLVHEVAAIDAASIDNSNMPLRPR